MAYNNDHTSSYFDQDLSASHFPPNFLFDDSRSSTPAQMTLNKTAPTWGPFSAIDASPKDPRPGWFISRGNSVLVPLIALDDLPDTVQLRDVPRFMVPKQTSGMEFLGEFPATGFKYNMSTVPPPPEVAAQHDRERSRTSAGLGLGVPRVSGISGQPLLVLMLTMRIRELCRLARSLLECNQWHQQHKKASKKSRYVLPMWTSCSTLTCGTEQN